MLDGKIRFYDKWFYHKIFLFLHLISLIAQFKNIKILYKHVLYTFV